MPDNDILQIAVQAAENYRETESRNATHAEIAKEFFGQLLPTLTLSLLNAYFFVDPAAKYGQTEEPHNPAIAVRDSVSATATNFLFAVYACTALFNELRKPYGSSTPLVKAILMGLLAATPTFFMNLMEVPNPSVSQIVLAIAVTIGAVPGQTTGLLRFIKSIWATSINQIKANDNFLGRLLGNPEIARAELELSSAFNNALSESIELYIRGGDRLAHAILFSVANEKDFFKQMLAPVVDNNSQTVETSVNKLTVVFKEGVGFLIGFSGSAISLIGASVPLTATYFGIRKLFSDPTLPVAKLVAGSVSVAVNISATMLAMIFGFKTPIRLYNNAVDVILYILRSIRNRKLEKPQLPIEIDIAKIASFILIPIGGLITLWSYATMERLLQNTYGIQEDPANPNKIIISLWLFVVLQNFVKIRSVIFNATGVCSVSVDAAMWLTKCFGDEETRNKIITYGALQQIPRVLEEATPEELAEQLCKTYPEKELSEVTKLSVGKISEIRATIKDGKELQNKIDNLQDKLDNVKQKLAKYGCCFRFMFWKQDAAYSDLLNRKKNLESKLKIAEENYKNYTYKNRNKFTTFLNDDYLDSDSDDANPKTPLLAGNRAPAV